MHDSLVPAQTDTLQLLLTTNVSTSAICDIDVKVNTTATGILAKKAFVVSLLDCTLQSIPLSNILSPTPGEPM